VGEEKGKPLNTMGIPARVGAATQGEGKGGGDRGRVGTKDRLGRPAPWKGVVGGGEHERRSPVEKKKKPRSPGATGQTAGKRIREGNAFRQNKRPPEKKKTVGRTTMEEEETKESQKIGPKRGKNEKGP